MSKYVDKEKVQRLIIEAGNRHSRNGEDIQTCSSICADLVIGVHELPTADVREIKRGRWIRRYRETIDGKYLTLRCPVCDNVVTVYFASDEETRPYNYCPYCGSRMDLEGEQNG